MPDVTDNKQHPTMEPGGEATSATFSSVTMESLRPEKISATSIRSALKDGRLSEVITALGHVSSVRRAELFVQLKPVHQKQVLNAAPSELAASILADADSASIKHIFTEIDLGLLSPSIQKIPPDNMADILLHLPPQKSDQILAALDASLRDDVKKLMTFDPETAGGLMTTRYLSVPDVVSVGRAIELLRTAKEADGSSYIYIVDANGRLSGVAPLRKTLLANPRQLIRDVMVKDVVQFKTSVHREDIVRLFSQYHFLSIPVADEKGRLVGIVTFDDVMAAMREVEESVVHGVTGIDPREALKETLVAARNRLPWITATIIGGLACTFVSGLFQGTISELVVLAVFITIVLAVAESIGAQTVSVVLTTLAGDTCSKAERLRFIRKEIVIGILVGVYSGLIVGLASLVWHGNYRLGILIGGAILLSVSWAALLAVLIPWLMKTFRVNPVIASGPLVLALADISTVLVYLGGATLFMSVLQ